jgi:hypothetical protein
MASWRDTTSTEAQDDLDGLLNAVIGFAEQTLLEHGGLSPFGASVATDGDIGIMAVDTGEDGSDPEQTLADLRAAARKDAAAFVSAVLLEDDTEALRIEMEHREGVTFEIFLPYARDTSTQEVTFGEMNTTDGEARVWGAGAAAPRSPEPPAPAPPPAAPAPDRPRPSEPQPPAPAGARRWMPRWLRRGR